MSSLALAIAVKGAWDPDRVARRLHEAGAGCSAEIHLACNPAHAPASPPGELTVHTKADSSLFDLWALAIAHSRAQWVAILHADGLPAPGWFAAIGEAISRHPEAEAFMGPVEPDFGPVDRRMIGYLTEYVQFHRPWDARLKEVPGTNLILPRARLEGSGDFSKTRLLQQGLAPTLVEDAAVLYSRPLSFRDYCRRRFRHGRAYAASRNLSPIRGAALSLALPFVRTARVLRHAWRHRQLRSASLRWLPAIFLAETHWSLGELTGYATRRPGNQAALD